MKKTLKTILALCLALCALCAFAACGGGETSGKATYRVTVTCSESYLLNGVKVVLLKEDGSKAGESSLTDGVATFQLDKGTYRVTLDEKLEGTLENYTYEEKTVTAESTSVTIAITEKADDVETVRYCVTVTYPDGKPVEGISVQLCGGPEGAYTCTNSPVSGKDGVCGLDLPAGDYEVHILSTELEKFPGYTFDDTLYKLTATSASVTAVLKTA